MKLLTPVLLACLIIVAGPSSSQTVPSSTLVNLDTPSVEKHGSLSGRLDLRAFSGDEDIVYTSLSLSLGLGNGLEGILRGTFGERKSLVAGGGTIGHGGNDFEALLKVGARGRSGLAGLIGASIPDTPAQSGNASLTLGGTASTVIGKGSSVYLNPRAIFIKDNTIVGIGIGARLRLSDSIVLVGDYTPIISGDNTLDTGSGALKRRDFYGAALRFTTHKGDLSIDLGYTNAAGSTTGFSMTPGLGGSSAIYFALTARH
jgi:hypothetical protein